MTQRVLLNRSFGVQRQRFDTAARGDVDCRALASWLRGVWENPMELQAEEDEW